MFTDEIPLMSRRSTELQGNRAPSKDFPTQTRSFLKSKFLEAWGLIIASGALAGTVILVVNVIALVVIYYTGYHSGTHDIAFFTGSCRTASNVTVGAHVVVNALSTILLAYSNVSMQCLSSPTRNEVDLAHSKRQWLNIGTPSVRNIFSVSKTKAALWLLLCVSSFPLHMIWNSAVFQTKSSNDYFAIAVTENFLNGANWTIPQSPEQSIRVNYSDSMDGWTGRDFDKVLQTLQNEAMNSQLEKLDVKECVHKYHTETLSDRGHVLLVYDNSSSPLPNNNTESFHDSSVGRVCYATNPAPPMGWPLYEWMCREDVFLEGRCPTSDRDYSNWKPCQAYMNGGSFGWSTKGVVRYCYSQKVRPKCRVSIIPTFLISVIACNVVKIACFVCTLHITKKDPPLCTTGDAIKSFLERPDPHTRNRCLAAKEDYDKRFPASREWISRLSITGTRWTGRRYRWWKAANKWQWLLYTLLPIVCLATVGIMFLPRQGGFSRFKDLGEAKTYNSVSLTKLGILTGFLLANIPQFAVSYTYLALNNIMTTMLAMAEWCTYSMESGGPGNGLRVSSPAPNTAQRSTYFLSIPYKWAVPWAIVIGVLHWIVSEMFFFARLDIFQIQPGGTRSPRTFGHIYISPLGLVLAIGLGASILFALVLTAFIRKYPANIPLAGCCSASIAAACHPSQDDGVETQLPGFDPDLSCQRLKWGAVRTSDDEDSSQVGHATFAAAGTTPLVKGKLYA